MDETEPAVRPDVPRPGADRSDEAWSDEAWSDEAWSHDARSDEDRPRPRPPVDATVGPSWSAGIWAWCREHAPDAAIVAAITLLMFPRLARSPVSGLDPSFMAGISQATVDGLRFGPDVLFTYGPLGELSYPFLYFPKQWLLAVVVAVASRVVLIALTYGLLRRVAPRWVCLVVLALALPAVPTMVAITLIATLWAVIGVTRDRPFPLSWVLGAGVLCAVTGLIKLDSAVLCVAVLGAAIVGKSLELGRPADALVKGVQFVATLGVALVALWLLVGQSLGDLPGWVRGGIDLTRGYAEAMGMEDPLRTGEYLAALVIVVWIAAGTVRSTDVPWRRRASLGVVVGIALLIGFRQGFTRHDAHATAFFVPIVFLAAALASTWGLARAAALGAAGVAVLAIVSGTTLTDRFHVEDRIQYALDVAHLTVDGSARTEQVHTGREQLRREYAIPDDFLARMTDQTVHISPWETTIAYAYPEIIWDPLPVFQEYAAYTPQLDRRNADRLASEDRPRFVLKHAGTAIDGRLSRWESPEATLELACRYRQVGDHGGWLLLEAGPDRCGDPTPVTTVELPFGQPVPVPEASGDDLVVARISGINESLADRVRTTLFKARSFLVTGDDGHPHAFVPGTQSQWHVVRAPACTTRMLDGQAWVTDTMTFSSPDASLGSPGSVTVEYATIPFSC